ncbi:MAG: tetratricopeptide repeat protein [Acidobacteriota bacterium]
MVCLNCGYGPLLPRAKFCLNCGAQLQEQRKSRSVDGATAAQPATNSVLVMQTYGTRVAGHTIHLPPTLKHPTFGRKKEMEELTTALRERQTVLLHGRPGLGKTDLAAWVTQRLYDEKRFADGIIWVDKIGGASVGAVCDVIAIHLGNNEITRLEPQGKLAATRKLLDRSDSLLILDDLATSKTALAFVEFCRPCDMALLATSRDEYSGFDLSIELSPLERATAVSLFENRARQRDLDQKLMEEICELLDNHPLAVVLAAGCVSSEAGSLSRLKEELIEVQGSLKKSGKFDPQSLKVRASFKCSYVRLSDEQQWLFKFLSACFVESVGTELLQNATKISAERQRSLINELTSQALIEFDADRVCFHPLMAAFGREILGEDLLTLRDGILETVLAFAERHKEAKSEEHDHLEAELGNLCGALRYAMSREAWSDALKLADQLYDLLEIRNYWAELAAVGQLGIEASERLGEKESKARLLVKTAVTLKSQGRYEESISAARQSLEILEQTDDLASTSKTLFLLGLNSQYLSAYLEARDYFQRARDLCQRINDQTGTALCLHQLGIIAHTQLDYATAEKLYEEALKIRLDILGPKHPDVAAVFNALALLSESMGNYTSAERKYRDALTAYQSPTKENFQDFAGTLNNLANLYYAMGNFPKSKRSYKRALEIRRDYLSKEHPDIAQSLSNLANLYYTMGNYSDAASLAQQALEIYRVALGEMHPNFANALNNLANIYYATGDYNTAEQLYRQALEIKRNVLGEKHPDVAQILINLSLLCEARGQYPDAEPLLIQARNIYAESLGESHPNYAQILNNLGLIYEAQRKHEDALPLLEQALDIRRKALREDHPDIAQSLGNLALLYQFFKRYSEALPLFQEAIKIYRTAFGDKHLFVARSLTNLALLYEEQGQLAEAEPVYREAAAIYRVAAGEDHQDFIATLSSLAELHRTLAGSGQKPGNYREAESLYTQLLEIYHRKKGSEQVEAQTLHNLGSIALEQGQFAKAHDLFSRSLEIKKGLGDQAGVAHVLEQLGQLALQQKNLDEAVRYYTESLNISQKLNDQVGIGRSFHQLGVIAQESNNYPDAQKYYAESLDISTKLGTQGNIARNLQQLGQVAQEQGNLAEAQRLDEESKEIIEHLNFKKSLVDSLNQSLNEVDLRKIGAELGVPYDELPGEGIKIKVDELVGWTYRHGKINELQTILAKQHSDTGPAPIDSKTIVS